MEKTEQVSATDFARNFGHYKLIAQRSPLAVSSHGSIAGYFVSPKEFEEFQQFKKHRRSFATAELTDEKAAKISAARMDPRHAHLDDMLEPK